MMQQGGLVGLLVGEDAGEIGREVAGIGADKVPDHLGVVLEGGELVVQVGKREALDVSGDVAAVETHGALNDTGVESGREGDADGAGFYGHALSIYNHVKFAKIKPLTGLLRLAKMQPMQAQFTYVKVQGEVRALVVEAKQRTGVPMQGIVEKAVNHWVPRMLAGEVPLVDKPAVPQAKQEAVA